MEHNEERRYSTRRVEDLEKLYVELKQHIEIVKVDTSSTKNLIQSNANMLQANQKLLEGKLDNLKEIVTDDIKRIEVRSATNEGKITELTDLSNKIKGSLATFNWIGMMGLVMATLAFIKVMFFGKP